MKTRKEKKRELLLSFMQHLRKEEKIHRQALLHRPRWIRYLMAHFF